MGSMDATSPDAPDGSTAPSAWLRVLEARAVLEMGAAATTAPWLRRLRHGDGHPVLVLPGFLTDDQSTAALRYVLRGQGYRVHRWGLGRNLGPTADTVIGLRDRVAALYEEYDEPISLVGQSLGGIYARRLAVRYPEMVRQVVTLGSPFRMTVDDRSAVSPMVDRMRPSYVPTDPTMPGLGGENLSMPSTSVYSRTDGVVRWWQCLESKGPRRENIEVRGSHSGMSFNPAVIYAVGDRLAVTPAAWEPFEPPSAGRHLYPPPAVWRPTAA